jgi:hypothetical protein
VGAWNIKAVTVCWFVTIVFSGNALAEQPQIEEIPTGTSADATAGAQRLDMDARVASLAPFADFFVLDIPQINLWQAVVEGDQSEIDAGHVTAIDWSSHGFPKSCLPDEGCTVWLGGHRSSHGSVFARIPELVAGSVIAIHHHGEVFTYVVESALITGLRAPRSVIHGDLVVQTSLSNARRLLVYATSIDHWFESASCTSDSSEPTCSPAIALPRPARF